MFRFKQFSICQDRCPMKVGTDGVLVGAWASADPAVGRVLDIGTGTGLVALMLAQRMAGAVIWGVDVDEVSQARENAAASPWGDRVEFFQCPVQEFSPAGKFGLIVANPPYFVDSLTCPNEGRTTARHAVCLSQEELCEAVVRLLAADGRFAVILPVAEAGRFLNVAAGSLALRRRTDVRTTPRRVPKRVLLEFSLAEDGSEAVDPASIPAPECSELVVGTGEHEQYTPQYRALTGDFYLKF